MSCSVVFAFEDSVAVDQSRQPFSRWILNLYGRFVGARASINAKAAVEIQAGVMFS
jgi:hypothetical protein